MTMIWAAFQEQKKMIANLEAWLEKGVEYAKAKSFDPLVLLSARLAPDQYSLIQQIQSACDSAKFTGARLAAKEAPKNADTEKTLEEIRARIQSCKSFLDTLKESDFDGAEKRVIPLGFMPGKGLGAVDYLFEMQIPNFFFHVTTAYSILRHNGVDLGKTAYIGSLNLRDV
jgi:hypothetical protein